ncbi:toxin-antitoxin system YwqK family antitoxin [Aureibaculum conchae]|uniref:toxin-antitoxin system YwqK family antitoxin n=1 Tax=Aureibaculum sp. 2308TA14-22 TaxID=3108392 RepID=UPI00339A2680
MRIILLLLIIFFSKTIYAQDSIVNFLDGKNNVTTAENARNIRIIVKRDSIWEMTIYKRGGFPVRKGFYKTKDLKVPQGQFQNFSKSGIVTAVTNYNKNGLKDGVAVFWFKDGAISHKGIYKNGKKEGVWNYYHHNGKLASRVYAKNNDILKYQVWDENGKSLNDTIICKKPTFKGGNKKFIALIKRDLVSKISYDVKGKIYVDFIIDFDGSINEITISEKVPKKFEQQIISFFRNLPYWNPRIHMNRKVQTEYNIPLKFASK